MVQSRPVGTRVAIWAGGLVVVAVLAWLGWQLRSGDLDRSDKLASVLSLFVGLVSVAVGILQLRQSRTTESAEDSVQLQRASDMLAEAVRTQWEAEAGTRSLSRPEPLQLSWSSTSRPVAAAAHTVVGRTVAGRATQLRLHGLLDRAAETYVALPHHRLVILGKAGAGKTVLAMLLTLELLGRRQHHEPVPLLLSVSSWDPGVEHVHAWITRRLGEDYPALRNTTAYGGAAIQRLVASRRILPILDGLDELPGPSQAGAIRELNRSYSGQPLVVTSRSKEYEDAVRASGEVLTAAAVVEIEPVPVNEVIAFLAGDIASDARWEEVFTHLRDHPDGPLAAAFSTPLIVALSRTIYTPLNRDPSELLAVARSGGQAAVEDHVLAAFLPAVYEDRPSVPGVRGSAGRPKWTPDQAHRWLSILAVFLNNRGTADLAWWELRYLAPRGLDRLVVGLMVGLLAWLLSGWNILLVLGLGITGAVAAGSTRRTPARVVTRIRGRAAEATRVIGKGLLKTLVYVLLGGLLGGLIGVFMGDPVGWFASAGSVAFVGGFLAGPVYEFEQWLGIPAEDAAAASPLTTFRGDRTVALLNALLYGLMAALVILLLAITTSVRMTLGLRYALVAGGGALWDSERVIRHGGNSVLYDPG